MSAFIIGASSRARSRSVRGGGRGGSELFAGASVTDHIQNLQQGLAGLCIEGAPTATQIREPRLGVLKQRFGLRRRRGPGETFQRMERPEETIDLGAFRRRASSGSKWICR